MLGIYNIMEKDEDVITLKEFVAGCRTKGTGNAYRVGVVGFLSTIYDKYRAGRKSTELEFEEYDKLSRQYIAEKRNAGKDIVAYVKKMQDDERPPKSISLRVAGVREWLKQNDISLSEKERGNIRRIMPRRVSPQTHFQFFDYEKLQTLLPFLDIRMQALTLGLASSGARVSELLNAKISDIRDDKRPVSIFLRKTKTAQPRPVFITDEAYQSLRAWFKVRPEYMRQAGERGLSMGIKRRGGEDDRIFPFALTSIYRAWHGALKKAGLFGRDNSTGRNELTVHRLRAWNRDRVSSVIGADYAEIFLGHVDQYGNTYKDTDEPILAEKYRLCEQALTIKDSGRVKHDIRVQADVIRQQETTIAELRARVETSTTTTGGEVGALRDQLNELSKLVYTLNEERRDLLSSKERATEDMMIEEGAAIAETLKKQKPDGSTTKSMQEYAKAEYKKGRYTPGKGEVVK
jgi:integrase